MQALTLVLGAGLLLLAQPKHSKKEIDAWGFLRLTADIILNSFLFGCVLYPILKIVFGYQLPWTVP